MQDKRRCHRLKIQLPACYRISDQNDDLAIGSTIDISAIGICLLSKEKLEVGQELPIQVTLPEDDKIVIHVKVIWVKEAYDSSSPESEYKMGLKILEPLKGGESKLVRYYAKQLLTFFADEGKK